MRTLVCVNREYRQQTACGECVSCISNRISASALDALLTAVARDREGPQ